MMKRFLNSVATISRRTLFGVLVFALLIGSIPLVFGAKTAHAVECDEVYYSTNDILYYNPCAPCYVGGGASLFGSSNEEKIFQWFVQKGLNSAQAAGILGNIHEESQFNPFRMQTTYSQTGLSAVLPIESHSEYNKAFGLVQWDGSRRQEVLKQISSKFPDYENLINTHGKSADGYTTAPTDVADEFLTFSLEYVWMELEKGYTSVFNDIKSQPDTEAGVREATEIWNRRFEVSADYTQNRHDQAVKYWNEFKGKAAPTEDVESGGCSNVGAAGDVVHYSQTDPKWAKIGYSGSTIGTAGCGPTSMAMILASLVNKSITPPDVAAVAGTQKDGTSSHANLINGVNKKWGLNISTNSLTMDEAIDFVKSGKGYVWMGGSGKPPFTNGGHMVAMVGVAADGQVTIADPFDTGEGHKKITNYPASQIASQAAGMMYGVPKK